MIAKRPGPGRGRRAEPALALLGALALLDLSVPLAPSAAAAPVADPPPESDPAASAANPSAPGPEAGDGRDDARAYLQGLVNAERLRLALPPLALDAALSRAAQAHADDMTRHEYFGFTSPDGTQIEAWVAREGYSARLVTEKLAHSDLPLAELVADWGRHADRNRRSVFHPEVRDLGIGFGDYRGVPLYALALAQSQEDYARARLLPDLERTPEEPDLEALGDRLVELLNAARKEAGRAPLRHDPTLDRMARSRAETIASGDSGGNDSLDSRDLYRIAVRAGYRPDLRRGIAEIVARGPLDAGDVTEVLMASASYKEPLSSSFFLEIGVGVSLGGAGAAGEAVWVLCLGRPRR